VENVAALLHRGVGDLLRGLAENGYDAEWHCIRASDLGAAHERDRIWIIAYPVGSRREGLVSRADFIGAGPWGWRGEEDMRAVCDYPFERGDRWPQPLLRRVDDGLSGRVDRLHLIGNAIVPKIAEIIGHAIMRAGNGGNQTVGV
jgi:DNA (cytosine-5)-methyltransferase 1